jgi:hypothetical protein
MRDTLRRWHKTQDGTALDLMKWRVNGSTLTSVGHPANFGAHQRVFRRILACYVRKSPVSCVFSPGVFTPESTSSQAGDEWNSK